MSFVSFYSVNAKLTPLHPAFSQAHSGRLCLCLGSNAPQDLTAKANAIAALLPYSLTADLSLTPNNFHWNCPRLAQLCSESASQLGIGMWLEAILLRSPQGMLVQPPLTRRFTAQVLPAADHPQPWEGNAILTICLPAVCEATAHRVASAIVTKLPYSVLGQVVTTDRQKTPELINLDSVVYRNGLALVLDLPSPASVAQLRISPHSEPA